MATLLPAGATISALASEIARNARKLPTRQRHYTDPASSEVVVNRPLVLEYLRFNGIRASLNQVDVLPYDHMGDQYGDSATIADTPCAPIAELPCVPPRSAYRKHVVVTSAEVSAAEAYHSIFTHMSKPDCSQPQETFQGLRERLNNTAPK